MAEPRPSAARLAEEWAGRVGKIARNLTDFNDSDEVRRVRARLADPAVRYAGRSHAEARRAVTILQGLWQDYLLLSQVTERATALTRRSSLLSNHDEEVRALLEGPSVRLPSVSVPVTARGLLDAAETQETITPRDVLDSMKAEFSAARDIVTALVAAEEALSAKAALLRKRGEAAAAWLAAQGLPPALYDLAGLDADPLSGTARLGAAESAIAAVEARRSEAERASVGLAARVAMLRAGLAGLRAEEEALAGDRAEAARSVAGDGDDEVVPASADPLGEWLGRLEGVVSEGRAPVAEVGLGKLEEALAKARAEVAGARERIRGPVAELEDLRGLFRVLRVKAAAVAAGYGDIGEMEARAKAALRTEPVRVAEARAFVKAYEAALARAGGRMGGRA